jgi:hypothetical protein
MRVISNSLIFIVGLFVFYLHQKSIIMIQRVQTLFLLGMIICMALVFVFPIWEKTNPESSVKYTLDAFYWYEFAKNSSSGDAWEVVHSKQIFYLAGLSVVSCFVALFSIFQYKKRLFQMKLGALNAFVLMAFVAVATYFIYQGENQIEFESKGVFKVGYFLPLGTLLFNSLANRFIKKDEKLVRSVDRIR